MVWGKNGGASEKSAADMKKVALPVTFRKAFTGSPRSSIDGDLRETTAR